MSVRIFYDHQTFSQQLYGGISRYFCELITGINRTENQAHLSLLHSNNAHLREYGLNTMPYYFPKRHRTLHLTNRYYNLLDLKFTNFDVYHATYFDSFFIKYINPKPYVVTYYDMIYEKLGHQFSQLSADRKIVSQKKDISKGAAGLIAISEHTKKDMVDFLDIPPERIQVIYLGSSLNMTNKNPLIDKVVSRPYLLYVGNRSAYKNFIPFLIAAEPVLKQSGLRLICAGGGNFNEDERRIMREYNLETYVEQRSITDQVLIDLYSHAEAFIFPSLYEGFGIPVLEAMTCQCPCLLSNCSSLPEVGGDAAVYFDPNDVDDMRSALFNVIDNSVLRADLIKRGVRRASNFSWERTVRETLALYTRVMVA